MKTRKPTVLGGPGDKSSSASTDTDTLSALDSNADAMASLDGGGEKDTSTEEEGGLSVLDAAEQSLSLPPGGGDPPGGGGGDDAPSTDGKDSSEEGGDKEEGDGEAKASGDGSGDQETKTEGEEVSEENAEAVGGGEGSDQSVEEEDGEEGKEEGEDQAVEGGGAGGGDGDVGLTETAPPDLVAVPEIPEPELPTFAAPSLDDQALEAFSEQNGGTTPGDHASMINGRMGELHTTATGYKGALITSRDEHLGAAETARVTAEGAVQTAVDTGRGRVKGVFDTAGTDAVAAANTGIGLVEKSAEAGVGQIDTVAEGRKGEVKTTFDGAKTNVDTTRQGGAKEYQGILEQSSKGLEEQAKTVKDDAKKQGDAKAKEHESAAKGKKGVDSLHEESKAEVAKDVATGAGNAVDMRVKVRTHDLQGRAEATASTAVEVETESLSTELDAKKTTADANIEAGRVTSQGKLTAMKDGAIGSLESARDTSVDKATAENERAQARLDAAEQTLRDDAEKMALEMQNSIEVKAATDAATYADVTRLLGEDVASWEGPVRFEDVQGTLESATESLTSSHGVHLEELASLAEGAIGTYEDGIDRKIDTFDGAVETQETEARAWAEALVAEVNKTSTDFDLDIQSMTKAFDTTLGEQIAPVAPAAKALEEGAVAAVEKYKELVQGAFDTVKEELVQVAAEELAKIPQQIEEKAQEKTNSKRINIVSNDIPSIFSAMDGMGTDENGIFSVLRKMSYGQIEALESLWNKYKKHSLRWYFDDEMSGDDLATGLAYLNHNRAKALKLELESSTGFWNDDEARIEEVMKSASAEEMETLTTQYASTIEETKGALGGADLDSFNALADTTLSRDEAKSKSDAIRLHEAMDGMGTDEEKVKQLLEAAKTPEERERLKKFYGEYAGSKGEKMDLDARIEYEFTGAFEDDADYNLVKALAKDERSDAEVAAAKVYAAGDGAGTDEKAMFDALKSDVGKWDTEMASLTTALQDPSVQGDARVEMEIKLAELQKKKSDHFTTLDSSMKKFTGDNDMTMDAYLKSELDAGLELKIAQDAKDKGKSNPADLIEYSTRGMGTDEEMFKKALQDDQGNPLSKEEVAKIDADLKDRGMGGISTVAEDELGGRDAHDVAKLELGKPENADDLKKLVDMDYEFENSGLMGRGLMWTKQQLGMSTAMEEMDYAKEQFDAEYSDMVEAGTNDLKFEELAKTDNEAAQLIQELGITSQKSSEAYGKSLAATVDALVTALEIIGGVIATIATAGAASPALAMLIANIAIGTAGIVLKKAAIGDAYGYDSIAQDFVKMASTAALGAALSKVDKLGKIAEAAGTKGTKLFQDAGTKAGTFFSGKAWEMGPKAQAYLNTFIKSGTENALGGVVTDTYSGLWNEQNFDKGVENWLGGAAMQGIGGVPQSFVTGGAQGMYGKWSGDRKKDAFMERAGQNGADVNVDPKYMTHGSMTADVMYGARDSMAKFAIGHVTTAGNYADAGKFWEGLATGGPKSMLTGALNAWGDRKALPANVARDLENGSMTAAQYDLLHGELTEDERYAIGSQLPPSRQPEKIKLFLQMEAEAQLMADSPTGGGVGQTSGGGAPAFDKEKLASADAKTIGLALNGGLPWDAVKDREWTAAEKVLLARYAAGTGKLPKDFLGEDMIRYMALSMTVEDQIAFAVDAGWDTLPKPLQEQAKYAITATVPSVTVETLMRFKGHKLPDDLKAAVVDRFGSMSDGERIQLGQSFGLSDLDQLPPEVKKGVQEAIGKAVTSGESKDPSLIVSAMQSGQMPTTDAELAKLDLSPEQKLAVLSGFGFTEGLQTTAPNFAKEALAEVTSLGPKNLSAWTKSSWGGLDEDTRQTMVGHMDKLDLNYRLSFYATVDKSYIPQNAMDNLAKDLKAYKVGAALGGRSDLSRGELALLETYVDGQDTAVPQVGQ